MSVRRAFLCGAFLVVTAGAACASFTEGSPSTDPADGDGGDGGNGGGDGGVVPDAITAETGFDGAGPCRVVIDDDFDSLGMWETFGSPKPIVSKGEVMLINDQPSQGGALRWPAPISGTRFTVQATFRIGPKPVDAASVGDGIAFAWMPGGMPFAPTSKGQDMYLCDGLNDGNVVVVGSSNHRLRIGTMDADNCGTGGTTIPAFDLTPHTLSIEVAGTAVRATLDGDLDASTGSSATATIASAYSPFYFVIGSSSGGAYAAHHLQKIVVTACD